MTLPNAEEICQGLWTRTQKDKNLTKKTVIDYILISTEHKGIVKRMKIDEKKEITPYRDKSKDLERKYTDHNMISVQLNLHIQVKNEQKVNMKMDKEMMTKFKEQTERGDLTKIWENESMLIHERYSLWNKEVLDIARKICT